MAFTAGCDLSSIRFLFGCGVNYLIRQMWKSEVVISHIGDGPTASGSTVFIGHFSLQIAPFFQQVGLPAPDSVRLCALQLV
jgi:hypothetical protein